MEVFFSSLRPQCGSCICPVLSFVVVAGRQACECGWPHDDPSASQLPSTHHRTICLTEEFQCLAGQSAGPDFLRLVTYKAMTFSDDITAIDSCKAYHSGRESGVWLGARYQGGRDLYPRSFWLGCLTSDLNHSPAFVPRPVRERESAWMRLTDIWFSFPSSRGFPLFP